jgi:hypothetical protein
MDKCPNCNKSWVGDPIPADIVQHYSGTNWELQIGIDGGLLGIYDGLVAVLCPFCGSEFAVSDDPRHKALFQKYLSRSNNESRSTGFHK